MALQTVFRFKHTGYIDNAGASVNSAQHFSCKKNIAAECSNKISFNIKILQFACPE